MKLGGIVRSCVVGLVVAASACASRVVRTSIPRDYAWPPGEPRVALVGLFESRKGGGAAAFGWLTGEKASPLFERPYGVAWLGDDLVVADPGARRLLRVAASGKIVESAPNQEFAPLGVAACGSEIVASDSQSGRVARFDAALRRLGWVAEGLERPTGLACDADTVWIVETGAHRVLALGRDGTRRAIGSRGTGDGEFNFPVALARTPDALLVGDTLNFRVQRLDAASGRFLAAFGRLGDASGDTPRLKGLAVDAAGHVWASDAQLDQVSLYTPGGELLLTLGRTGNGPGEFSFPAGLAAHRDGRVAVAEALGRRVQVFRLLPTSSAKP